MFPPKAQPLVCRHVSSQRKGQSARSALEIPRHDPKIPPATQLCSQAVGDQSRLHDARRPRITSTCSQYSGRRVCSNRRETDLQRHPHHTTSNERWQHVAHQRHQRAQIINVIAGRVEKHDREPHRRQMLLMLQTPVHRQEDPEPGDHRATEERAVPGPVPAELLHGAHVMPGQLVGAGGAARTR